jgi:hypothetical protein
MAAIDMGKSWETGRALAEVVVRGGDPGSGGTNPFQVEAEGPAEEITGADARKRGRAKGEPGGGGRMKSKWPELSKQTLNARLHEEEIPRGQVGLQERGANPGDSRREEETPRPAALPDLHIRPKAPVSQPQLGAVG